jgi:hypothetical protein
MNNKLKYHKNQELYKLHKYSVYKNSLYLINKY